LPAVARPGDASAAGHVSVFVPALPSLEHILVDARGRQHVVLRANGVSIQLVIEGADVVSEPVAITFLVRGLGAIGRAADHLATLRRILSPTARLSVLPRWTPTTRKLRDALVALDGRAAGARYRDIAVVLHGIAYVERNWQTGLKERIRRHLKRGLVLSAGRYRHLLR
jgi:hypothetical protein